MRHLLSLKGMAATEEQLLCSAGSCPRQPGPSGSSSRPCLENSALRLFLGEETSCLPCFAAGTLGWGVVVAALLPCGLASLMELFWGAQHSSAVLWDPLFVLRVHSTGVQITFRLVVLE